MDGVHQGQKVVRETLGEGEGLLVGHLILKYPVGIQVHILIIKEEGTIGIALNMNLIILNLLPLMVK